MGPGFYAPTNNYFKKKDQIKAHLRCYYPYGHTVSIRSKRTYTDIEPITITTTVTSPWLSPTPRVLVKVSRKYEQVAGHVPFKEGNTIQNLLVAPKDKDKIIQKGRLIYRFRCAQTDSEEYIGESGRSFGDRLKKHFGAPSPIYDHGNTSGNGISVDNLSIVGRVVHSTVRIIKEAMSIRSMTHPSTGTRQIQAVPYLWWGLAGHPYIPPCSPHPTMYLPLYTLGWGTCCHIGKYSTTMGVPTSPLWSCVSPPLHIFYAIYV